MNANSNNNKLVRLSNRMMVDFEWNELREGSLEMRSIKCAGRAKSKAQMGITKDVIHDTFLRDLFLLLHIDGRAI